MEEWRAPASIPAYLFHLGAVVLLAFFLWETGRCGANASATADEPIYIRAGLLILEYSDPSINDISSPFLLKPVNALPLRMLEGALPYAVRQEERGLNATWPPLLAEWFKGAELVRVLGPDLVLPLARLAPRLMGLVTGLLIYLFAFYVIRPRVALASLAVFVLLPEVAAHSSLSTLEAGLTLCTLCTLLIFYRYLRDHALPWALLIGVGLGVTLLAKTTGMVLALFLVAAFFVRGFKHREERPRLLLGLALVVLASWVVINGAFGFKGSFDCLAERPEYSAIEGKLDRLPQWAGQPMKWYARTLPVLLPESMVHTLVTQAAMAGKGKRVFFNGALHETGWWWLMLATFGIKMPLAFLALLAAGFFFRKQCAVPWLFLAFPLFLLFFFTLSHKVNPGVRYLYPALPCLALAAGGGLGGLALGRLPLKITGAVLFLWLFIAQLCVLPHPLSYANETVGGPDNLYRWLGDSNLDWGQDLPALARTMEVEGIDRVRLSYFGSGDPAAYGIAYDYLPSIGLKPRRGEPWWFEADHEESFELRPGVYAISANNLNGLMFDNPDLFAMFKEREPDFRAGHSILLYDLR